MRLPSGAHVPGLDAYLMVTEPGWSEYEKGARVRFPRLNAIFDDIRVSAREWAQEARARSAADQGGQVRASSESTRLISARDAARRISCPLSTLQHAAKAGRLSGEKVGRVWLFDPADVDSYAAARRAD